MDIGDINIKEKQLLSRAFDAFNTSISKLRTYQVKLEEQIAGLTSELELKNRELTNVLQSLSNGLIVTNLDAHIQTFNRAASAITGFKESDALGTKINELFQLPILPSKLDKKALKKFNSNLHEQFEFKKSPEQTIILDSSTTLMENDEGEPIGIIVNLSDITLLRKLEEEAERKNRLTAMGEIAMQVAHEIRNPLGSIDLFISMMKKDFSEDSHEFDLLNHITAATGSMNHIISNLLEYTKPKPINLETVDLYKLLVEFVEFSRHFASQQSIEIKLDQADKHLLKGNRELVKQVFHNLFINACQAMPEGGNLHILTENLVTEDPVLLERLNEKSLAKRSAIPLIKVTFSDTGNGMSPEVKKKIFDPFYTTREQGTGLGMSIVHKTMTSHGGIISVESVENSGTKISLLFLQNVEPKNA